MISLIRSIISKFSSPAGKIARFSASGRTGETFTDREALQQFGFASGVPKGAEAILLKSGWNIYMIASDDRQYRPSVGDGEVCIYSKYGDTITIKKDHEIEIKAGPAGKVIVNANSVQLGGSTIDPTDGVVTGKCTCAYTGAAHPIVSQTVKAKI
jgi:phage gp45-like